MSYENGTNIGNEEECNQCRALDGQLGRAETRIVALEMARDAQAEEAEFWKGECEKLLQPIKECAWSTISAPTEIPEYEFHSSQFKRCIGVCARALAAHEAAVTVYSKPSTINDDGKDKSCG